jgi:DNA-directed RNA polymerase subunit RPC12/RpoP
MDIDKLVCSQCGKLIAYTRGISTDNTVFYCPECGQKEKSIKWGKPVIIAQGKPMKRSLLCADCGVQDITVTDTRFGVALCMECTYNRISKESQSEGYTPFGDE